MKVFLTPAILRGKSRTNAISLLQSWKGKYCCCCLNSPLQRKWAHFSIPQGLQPLRCRTWHRVFFMQRSWTELVLCSAPAVLIGRSDVQSTSAEIILVAACVFKYCVLYFVCTGCKWGWMMMKMYCCSLLQLCQYCWNHYKLGGGKLQENEWVLYTNSH